MNSIEQWIAKNNKNMTVSTDKNDIILNYNGWTCKLVLPSESNKYHKISIVNNDADLWLDKLNAYCITKKPNVDNILDRLTKCLEKYTVPEKKETKRVCVSKETIENFDMKYYSLKSELQKLIETSKSSFNVDTNVRKLFDKNVVANIIISEYLNLWKTFVRKSDMKIELLDNNIYTWKIQFYNFQNNKLNQQLQLLNEKFHYNYIELHIVFHDLYYPNYPPILNIVRPKLDKSLMHRIANSKMVRFTYWNNTRSVEYLINRIKYILETFADVVLNEKQLNNTELCLTSKLDTSLLQLASLMDVEIDDDIDKDEKFEKNMLIKKPSNDQTEKSDRKKGWTKGTGYGSRSSPEWNDSDYIRVQKEREKQILAIFPTIIMELQKVKNNALQIMCKSIENSLLLQYLIQEFKSITLFDMNEKENLYRMYFTLFETMAVEEMIHLFGIEKNGFKLYDVITDLVKIAHEASKIDKSNDFVMMIINLYEMLLKPLYLQYEKNTQKANIEKPIEQLKSNIELFNKQSVDNEYISALKQYKFGYDDIISSNYHVEWKKKFENDKSKNSIWNLRRISTEIASLSANDQLPIHNDASIFLRIDENNPMIMRALITGPPNTPYEAGCYIFDFYLPPNYPKGLPSGWFINHGGKRLNPNLYADGKVCLSLLGTWGNDWKEHTSTLYQLLISIQAQILIETPYFNEPGYESQYGTESGNKSNKDYNENIRIYMLSSTVADLIENPKLYPQFEDVIKIHFKLKKNRILELCDIWTNECSSSFSKTKMNKLTERIKKAYENL